MRDARTNEEIRILDRLNEPLERYGIHQPLISDTEIDAPDIVLEHASGKLGIEVSRMDYEGFCKWLNTAPPPPYSRSAEITINLKKMLSSVMAKKKDKYERYKNERGLDECWLILHNNVFEIKENSQAGVPNRLWFEENSQLELQTKKCPFDRVLFNLENPNIWYELFDKKKRKKRKSIITRWPSIILHEGGIQANEAKVYSLNLPDIKNRTEFE